MADEPEDDEAVDLTSAETPTIRDMAAISEFIPVDSSNLDSVAYSEGYQAGVSWLYRILFIRFKSGGTYAYHDVPAQIYTALMNAASKGKYFHQNIKSVYSWEKVPD